jgi:hypothetical protein
MATIERPSYAERCSREATRSVIFLLQVRRFVLTGGLPSDMEHDGDGGVRHSTERDEDGDPKQVTLAYLHREYGSEYVIEQWNTERVFLSREEADDWAKRRAYRWSDGYRVYGVPCEGELAELIKNT